MAETRTPRHPATKLPRLVLGIALSGLAASAPASAAQTGVVRYLYPATARAAQDHPRVLHGTSPRGGLAMVGGSTFDGMWRWLIERMGEATSDDRGRRVRGDLVIITGS